VALPAGTYYVAVSSAPDGNPAGVPGVIDPDYAAAGGANPPALPLAPAAPGAGLLFNGFPFGDPGQYTLKIAGADQAGGLVEAAEIAGLPLNNTRATATDLTGVAEFYIGGDVGKVTIGAKQVPATFTGDALFGGTVKQFACLGDVTGDLVFQDDVGKFAIGSKRMPADLTGSLTFQGLAKTVAIYGNVNSDLTFLDDVNKLELATGPGSTQVGLAGDLVFVDGNLKNLTAGSRNDAISFNADIDVSGALQKANIYGDVLGNLHAGSWRNGRISGDLGVHTVTTVNIDTELRSLRIGPPGNLYSDMNIGTNLGNLRLDAIWGDITVTNDVRSIQTTSTVLPQAVPPPDYIFDNGLDPNGSLTAGGEIGRVRQM